MAFFDKRVQPGLVATLEAVVDSPVRPHDLHRRRSTELEKHGRQFEFKPYWGCDLQTEHERYLTEKVVGGPVVVTDYPKEIKAFYMRLNDDGKTVARHGRPGAPASARSSAAPSASSGIDVLVDAHPGAGPDPGGLLVVPGPAPLRHGAPRGLRPRASSGSCCYVTGMAEHPGRRYPSPRAVQAGGLLGNEPPRPALLRSVLAAFVLAAGSAPGALSAQDIRLAGESPSPRR
ncbi:MAG: hypothetical protein MZV70_35650 [Desulfobacterales bacterium]|nr:hypothetical protein [Desulfobacterales bacterium]